jgi:glycosyltransferase involved in cell wall biosynthesis
MNILFLTLVKINSLQERGIYTDLLRKFVEEGHQVTIVCPIERRENKNTVVIKENNATIIQVKTLNLQKTNILEKGVGTLAIEYQYLRVIKKQCTKVKMDMVVYSTPPITFSKVIQFVKKRDNAYSYLLLKDIFPQNAVDMKMMKKNGFLHRLFLKKERLLYAISDTIGCMSLANQEYILKHNPEVPPNKIEVNPNSISPIEIEQSESEKKEIREKYGLPTGAKVLVYGGNLGIPQGLDFLLETILSSQNTKAFFLVVGSGTEFGRIQKWFEAMQPKNAKLVSGLPKKEYDTLLKACDVGLIFLNKNFTIPNFPSRLLSYLEMKMPVIAATDNATDIGEVIEKNNCGYKIISGDLEAMLEAIKKVVSASDNQVHEMQENAIALLHKEYNVATSYELIVEKIPNV